MNTMPKPGDKGAAFLGLIGSAVVIGLVLFGMVKWTDARFESHAAAPAAAGSAPAGH